MIMEQTSGLYNPGFVESVSLVVKLLTPNLGVRINLKKGLKIEKKYPDGVTDTSENHGYP